MMYYLNKPRHNVFDTFTLKTSQKKMVAIKKLYDEHNLMENGICKDKGV